MSLPVAACLIRTTVPVISTHKMGRKETVAGVLFSECGIKYTDSNRRRRIFLRLIAVVY
jgi:hypothetical protein